VLLSLAHPLGLPAVAISELRNIFFRLFQNLFRLLATFCKRAIFTLAQMHTRPDGRSPIDD
jgi:hypothetical protein